MFLWRFKSSPRHQIARPSQTTKSHEIHCIYSVILVFANSFRCLLLSLNVPFVERQWNVGGTQIGCPSRNLITDVIKPPAVHNADAGDRSLDIAIPSQTLATAPTHDSGLFIRCCRVDPDVRASTRCCMCRSKSGRRCWALRTATSRRTARRLSWKSLLKRQIASAEKSSAKLRH